LPEAPNLEKVEADRQRRIERYCKGDDAAVDALVVSQEYIKPRLRSPSTADFPYITYDGVSFSFLSDCVLVVRSYVDAQNAYGAIIRTRYLAKLQRDINNPDAWRLIDLTVYE